MARLARLPTRAVLMGCSVEHASRKCSRSCCGSDRGEAGLALRAVHRGDPDDEPMTEAETQALLALANAPDPKAGCPLNLYIGPLLVRRGWAELGSRYPLYRITEAGQLALSQAPIAARMTIEEYVLRRLSQGETDLTALVRDTQIRFPSSRVGLTYVRRIQNAWRKSTASGHEADKTREPVSETS